MKKYSLNELQVLFKDHSEKSAIHDQEMIKKFEENNPGEQYPEWFNQMFCLSEALYCMVVEINDLKKKINEK